MAIERSVESSLYSVLEDVCAFTNMGSSGCELVGLDVLDDAVYCDINLDYECGPEDAPGLESLLGDIIPFLRRYFMRPVIAVVRSNPSYFGDTESDREGDDGE